jgi:polysaccharide biosynthesis transport protein
MSLEIQSEHLPAHPADGRHNALPFVEQRSLMDVWRVLTKHRYIILGVTILAVTVGAYDAFHTPPVYESVSRVEVKPNEIAGADVGNYLEGEDSESLDLSTEVNILQSDAVLFETAQNLNLLSMVRGETVKNAAPDSASASRPISPQERAAMIGIVRGGLFITIVPGTRILEIRYRGTDPKLATAIVNELVDTYSDEDLRTKFERTEHVSGWLQKRLDDLRQEAADTQRQLADYQKAHNIVGADENSNLTVQTLERISSDLDASEAERIQDEARMQEFNSMKPDMIALMGDDTTLASLQNQLTDLQTQRAQLAARFGPNHPQIQQLDIQISQVQAEVDKEVQIARNQIHNEYVGALGTEGALRRRLGTQEDAAYRLNSDVAQYAILRHEAELTRTLYDTLQMRLKEASVTAGLSAANITVVDRADVPFVPVAPRKGMILMMGLFGGLLVGSVLSFVIESVDDRLRTSEEVESASMLPSIAAIPHMLSGPEWRKSAGKEEPALSIPTAPQQLITLWDPKSNGAEAYRGMRSSLLLSSIDNPPRVIVVTSCFPAEGKTTTCLNLAIVLAQRGERVLLVDADLRRGSLHRAFAMSDQSFGLSTALSQPGQHLDIPSPLVELPHLHVLPTGPRPPNPAEMLSSNRMEEQMREWTREFDRIVIDTAPLLAVSDTQAMAVRADAVLLIARAGVTRKRALIRARDLLWRINAPVAGVVVNDVDMRLENFYTYRYSMYANDYFYGYQQSRSSDRAYGYEDDERQR